MTSLYRALSESALAHADAVALKTVDASVTYRELMTLIDQCAGVLQSRGIAPGDRVGLTALKRPDFLVWCYACFRCGAVAVPVQGEDREKALSMLSEANVSYLLLPPDVPFPTDGTSRAALELIAVDLPSAQAEAPGEVQDHPVAQILFTSGTTSSLRKGVLMGHAGIDSTAKFMNKAMGVDGSIREIVVAPLDHAFGFGRCHAVLVAGGTLCVLDGKFNFQTLRDNFQDWDCNALSVVPSVLATMVRSHEPTLRLMAPRVRWLQTGAMKFERQFRERLLELLPDAGIFLHYGLTEAMRCTFVELRSERDKLHTEGRPADGVEMSVIDSEGSELGPNRQGEIRIRGRNLALGYIDETAWRSRFRDGWYHTGDIGALDDDGYLVFAGRNDDIINSNGFLVHPNEIEKALEPLLGAQEYCILGVQDPAGIRDKLIVLCTLPDSTVTLADVRSHLVGREAHLQPHKIVTVDSFPRTETGKIMRTALADSVSRSLSA